MSEINIVLFEVHRQAAHDMICALCRPRGSQGHRDWIMSIPAQPDYDPDLVIGQALRDYGELLLKWDKVQAVLTAAEKYFQHPYSEDYDERLDLFNAIRAYQEMETKDV